MSAEGEENPAPASSLSETLDAPEEHPTPSTVQDARPEQPEASVGPEEPSAPGAPSDGSSKFVSRPSDEASRTASLSDLQGLEALELEILDLLHTPDDGPAGLAPVPHPPRPAPSPEAPRPPFVAREDVWRGILPDRSPSEYEQALRAEINRLRSSLETIRAEIAEHKTAVAGVNGQLERVHSVLNEIRDSGTRKNGISGARATVPATSTPLPTAPPEDRGRPLSAAPVFFLDPQGKEVAHQAFFTLGKGGALEKFLTDVLLDWEGSGYPIEAKAGKEGFTLELQGDPEGRGLRLLPSGMYLLRLGEEEMRELKQLPPLVSSKVWPKSGGFMRKD